jgi:large subunit ribosomal protein L21
MFAVIRTGGKQYRVVAEDVLRIDRVDAAPGAVVEFGDVLVVGGDPALLGTPTVAGATVAGEVLDHVRGAKVIAFKKRRRKNSRRKRGHRQEFSLVRITEILTDGRRPSPTPPPRPRRSAIANAIEGAAAEDMAPEGAPAEQSTMEGAAPQVGAAEDAASASPQAAPAGNAAIEGAPPEAVAAADSAAAAPDAAADPAAPPDSHQ